MGIVHVVHGLGQISVLPFSMDPYAPSMISMDFMDACLSSFTERASDKEIDFVSIL